MALDNFISVSFTDEEVKKINSAVAQINEVLTGKAVNLSPDERRQFGSIADRNKILVDKVKRYMDEYPETLPRTLDKAEFDADYKARTQLEAPLSALARIMEKMQDTKILLDHDNYNAAVSYYRYIKYLASENEPGTTTIFQDLRKQYQGTGRPSKKADTSPEAPTATE